MATAILDASVDEDEDLRSFLVERVRYHLHNSSDADTNALVDSVLIPLIHDAHDKGLTTGWNGAVTMNSELGLLDLVDDDPQMTLFRP